MLKFEGCNIHLISSQTQSYNQFWNQNFIIAIQY